MKGQTLIEVLIALAIAVVIVTVITTISISSLSNAQYIRSQSQAAKYAQEGSEIVRRIRNSDYTAFQTYSGLYCLDADQSVLGSVVSECVDKNIADTFIRSVRIEQDGCSPAVAKIIVTVSYTSAKCQSGTSCHKAELASCLSTVNPVQAP